MRNDALMWAISAALMAGLLGWLVSTHVWTSRPPEEARPLVGLPLTAPAGATVRVDDYRGKVLVLVFGCVSCWEPGDSVLDELRRALLYLGGHADQVQVLVISVAPRRDTPERLAAHVQGFDSRFAGVVGSPEVIRRVTALGLAPDDPDAAPVMVLDQRGHLRLTFPFRISAPSLAQDLAALLLPMRS